MAKNNYQLTPQQKEEFRRLTQKANRRIAKAFREYEKEGLRLVPKALTGGFVQSRKEWKSQQYALSRSVTQFKTRKDYLNYMKRLRQFDVKEEKGGVPTFTEYKAVIANKIEAAFMTSISKLRLGDLEKDVMNIVLQSLRTMDMFDQKGFWDKFEEYGSKMGIQYSSEAAMIAAAMGELHMREDIKPIIIDAILDSRSMDDEERAELKRKLKYYGDLKLLKEYKKKK